MVRFMRTATLSIIIFLLIATLLYIILKLLFFEREVSIFLRSIACADYTLFRIGYQHPKSQYFLLTMFLTIGSR